VLPSTHRLLRTRLAIGFVLSMAALVVSEAMNQYRPMPDAATRLAAAQTMARAQAVVRQAKADRGIAINAADDPMQSGLIGPRFSPIVTDTSTLALKRAVTNPNLAAAVVGMLADLGVKAGDPVAICMTGSMPGANLAVLAAVQAIGAQSTTVVSVGPSMWGAADPDFTWLDMAAVLRRKGVISSMPVLATPGGQLDCAAGLEPGSLDLMRKAARRNAVPFVVPASLQQGVAYRERVFTSPERPLPRVLINVGGGVANYGTALNSTIAPAPIITPAFADTMEPQGLIYRMLRRGVPVINLHRVSKTLAGLSMPVDLQQTADIGTPAGLYQKRHRPLLPLATLTLGLVVALALLLRVGGVVPRIESLDLEPAEAAKDNAELKEAA